MRWRQRFFRRDLTEKRLDAELRFHLEQRIADLVGAGMAPEEARRHARLEFGGLDQVKEQCRDVGASHIIETFIQDMRYGLRQLRRNQGFTAVAVLTLALGIGANTAMFSVVDAMLLRPLPFRDPGRLVAIEGMYTYETNGRGVVVGWANWISKTQTLRNVSMYGTGGLNVSGGTQPENLPGADVTDNFFRLLGIGPVLGRTFLPDEEIPGHDVVIISYDLWQTRFAGDRKVIGKRIDLASRPFTIIGVMPPGFEFPTDTQLWVPNQQGALSNLFGEQGIFNRSIARLKVGVTPEQARSELLVFWRHALQGHPASFNPEVSVTPLHLELAKNVRPSLLVLMGAVGVVLLIACVDVANLLMARNSGRAHEITIRAAVGASRARLLRQMLTESVLLAMFGGSAGLVVGEGGIRLARALIPPNQVGASGIRLDGWVLAFTFAIALLTGVISGLLPALGGSKVTLSEDLKRTPAGSRRGSGLRAALGSTEVSLALILLIGASLLIKSLGALSEVNPGFRSSHLLSARLFLTAPEYGPAERRREFYEQVLDSARKLAAVREAAFVNSFPMGGGVLVGISMGIERSRTPDPQYPGEFPLYFSASSKYFRAMGIQLLAGREFDERDREGSTPVAILSQTAAREFFHNEDPVGKRVTIMGNPPKWMTVVGVVGDVQHASLGEKPMPALYVPLLQQPPPSAFLVLHTAGRVTRADIVRTIGTADRAEPVASVQTVEEIFSRSTAEPRFRAEILGIFAGLAMLIAAIGIYGVMAFNIGQRTHEIGVRMALGAKKGDVLRMVLWQGIKLALIGVAIGIAGALALTRFVSSFLYGVKPTDPLTFIAVSLILMAVALVACYIPARRATKVDPMMALRYE